MRFQFRARSLINKQSWTKIMITHSRFLIGMISHAFAVMYDSIVTPMGRTAIHDEYIQYIASRHCLFYAIRLYFLKFCHAQHKFSCANICDYNTTLFNGAIWRLALQMKMAIEASVEQSHRKWLVEFRFVFPDFEFWNILPYSLWWVVYSSTTEISRRRIKTVRISLCQNKAMQKKRRQEKIVSFMMSLQSVVHNAVPRRRPLFWRVSLWWLQSHMDVGLFVEEYWSKMPEMRENGVADQASESQMACNIFA